MDAFLEFVVIFFLAFRWFTLALGVAILIFLARLRKIQAGNWYINLGFLIAGLIFVISLYNILGIDFGFFLPD